MAQRTILPIDYVTKDYEGFKKLMMSQIPILAPDWTDTSEGDFGIVIMELLCYGLDILSFYQDKAVNEGFLPSAKTRKAVMNISRSLGYTMEQQHPAKFKFIVEKLEDFKDKPVTIIAGTKVGTDSKLGVVIPFEFDSDLTIPAGFIGNEKDEKGEYKFFTTVTHGESANEALGSGSGEAFQKFKLNFDEVLRDTINIWTVENGVVKNWTRVEDFLTSEQTSRHYVAYSNELNEIFIEFGDGLSGMRLPKDVMIYASYRIGGGKDGNVGAKTICKFLDEEVIEVDTMYNPDTPIEYGSNMESIERAKVLAPKYFKSNNRCVTKEDFEVFTCMYSGVSKAKCIETFNEDGDVYMYVANHSYTPTTDEFKTGIKNMLIPRMLINNKVTVKDAIYKDFSVNVKIQTYPEYPNLAIKTLVEDKLNEMFSVSKFDFGDNLMKSLIIKELMMLPEVLNVEIESPLTDLSVAENEILKLTSVSATVKGGLD